MAATQEKSSKKPKKAEPSMEKDELLKAYGKMLLIRRFEEKAGQLYGMGLIAGFCHLYIGQEAVVVGMQHAIDTGDEVITSYLDPRPHAGLRDGPEGRDGRTDRPRHRAIRTAKAAPCTMFSKEKGFFGGHGIVGAQVSLGTGLALFQLVPGKRPHLPDLFRRRRLEPGSGV